MAARLRGLRARAGRTHRGTGPEGARIKAALDMHELGVKLYRQRMQNGVEWNKKLKTWKWKDENEAGK